MEYIRNRYVELTPDTVDNLTQALQTQPAITFFPGTQPDTCTHHPDEFLITMCSGNKLCCVCGWPR